MGEVVVSSEERLEVMKVTKDEVEKKKESNNKEGNTSSMVRWENFLPKMSLRVLLVEADDSTRQIIGALLRKCSYKVACVADGLKAWEVLKGRPHNIDLILTEADLPSISGYALLTLIMEHEVCKNIPVIMMSTHDSVSVVYKCMLRGAADFLVKPIRINELKNLWQHVWRRQFQMNRGGLGKKDESVGQEKLEATAENNANSDRSSSSKTCAPRQDQCIKKGSDAQSSCGKPDVEAESTYRAEVEDLSRPKQGVSPVFDLIQENGNLGNSSHTPESAVAGSSTAVCHNNTAIDQDQKGEQQSREENVNCCTEANEDNDVLTSSSRQAIDLIGVLDNHCTRNTSSIDDGNRLGLSQQLDLTLRRFHPGVHENKTSDEMLNHSNTSAFTRYVNKAPHMSDSNPTSILTPKDNTTGNSADHLSNNARENKYRQVISLPTNTLAEEVEIEYRNASQKLFPIPLPGRGVRVESVCPVVCTPSPSPSPNSANQQINSYHQFSMDLINSRHHFHPFEQSPRLSSNQTMSLQDQKMEAVEDRAHFSSAADQSASSSLHNDTGGYVNGGGSEGANDQSHFTHDLNRQRSLQREAALNKFRLKRKERCYEKKVRYESRKKLAEQRPRVKGQFVRQVPPDPPPRSDHSGGN